MNAVAYLAEWPGTASLAMGWKDMGSEMSHSRHCPFSCAVRSCHMSLSMALPDLSRFWLGGTRLWGEARESSGGEASSRVRRMTLTNCGITLMAFAAPTGKAGVNF